MEIFSILFFTTLAGVCIPLGGAIATFEHIRPYWLHNELRHFVIAFGGGILLGSIAVVLLPQGINNMDGSIWSVPILLAGGVCFFAIERAMGVQKRETPQLMGMMLDYIPEAIALGGLMALGGHEGLVLALLIGLQNLPEGFNAYRELIPHNHYSRKRTLLSMLALVPLGPLAGLIGYYFLSDSPIIIGAIMLFSSGGILYLIFQDIAPQARLSHHWGPPLGAVLGFCGAVFSNMLIHPPGG